MSNVYNEQVVAALLSVRMNNLCPTDDPVLKDIWLKLTEALAKSIVDDDYSDGRGRISGGARNMLNKFMSFCDGVSYAKTGVLPEYYAALNPTDEYKEYLRLKEKYGA